MTLTKQRAGYFLCCYFFPALLSAEARWKLDRFLASYPSIATYMYLYLYLLHFPIPVQALLSQLLSPPVPSSLSATLPGRGGPSATAPPASRGKVWRRENPGTTNTSSTTRSEPDVFSVSLFFSFIFVIIIILLTSKQKSETYIGLFNFSCQPKSPRATSLYPQSF